MKALSHSCIGQRHLLKGIVCQDASASLDENLVSIALVSDGHGSAQYVRSDIGARSAVDVAMEKVRDFVESAPREWFSSCPLTAMQAGECIQTDAGKALRQLACCIVSAWGQAVEKDFRENPLEGEFSYEYYGCTLIGAVVTPSYWFAFHIGDGRCLAMDRDGTIVQPVPWDSLCVGNVTTSMCSENPLEAFRFCYGGEDTVPQALFLCSDGIEDSYLEEGALEDFFRKSLICAREEGPGALLDLYSRLFPELSRDCNPSGDDCSVAMLYDETL